MNRTATRPAQDELDSLKFAQLMQLAKALNVPGRGTARIEALRTGIRAARAAAAPVELELKLVSQTGSKVHYPAVIGQQVTHWTACAPMGRMGARQMRLEFTNDPRWAVDCKSCLKAGGPKHPA